MTGIIAVRAEADREPSMVELAAGDLHRLHLHLTAQQGGRQVDDPVPLPGGDDEIDLLLGISGIPGQQQGRLGRAVAVEIAHPLSGPSTTTGGPSDRPFFRQTSFSGSIP